MNCKPGDIALIVSAVCPANVGRLVSVLSDAPGGFWYIEEVGAEFKSVAYMDKTPASRSSGRLMAHDSTLRPIRPDEGDDETLTWAPVPQKVAA